MKNIGFRIRLNNSQEYRIGFHDTNHIVSCILYAMKKDQENVQEVHFSVGGLIIDTQQNVKWLDQYLEPGDKIEIEVVRDNFDPPKEVSSAISEEELLQSKIDQYHRLKEELKDHL